MTVSEMDSLLEELLSDSSEGVWTQTQRLKALNSAQRQIVTMVLGGSQKPAFDLLTGIQANKSISINTSGYSVSGLHPTPGRMIGETGFMRAEVTIDGYTQRCVRYTPDQEGLSQNYYLRGSNEYPVIRFEANSIYIDVDQGYYPVTTTLYYVREPKELVISGASGYQVTTCELDPGMHDIIVTMAEELCRRMNDDFEQVSVIQHKNQILFQLLMGGSVTGIKTGTIGQYNRKREEIS